MCHGGTAVLDRRSVWKRGAAFRDREQGVHAHVHSSAPRASRKFGASFVEAGGALHTKLDQAG